MYHKLIIPCLLSLAAGGCATATYQPLPEPHPSETPYPEPQQPASPVEVMPESVPEPAQPAVLLPNPAIISLTNLSRSQYQARDYQAAIATAERGLRIDRRAADMYLLLAQSYIQLGQPQKAKMFIQQGLRYASQGSEVEASLIRAQSALGH